LDENPPKSRQSKNKPIMDDEELVDHGKDDKHQKNKKLFVNLYSSEGQASIQSKLTGELLFPSLILFRLYSE
jgi:hypothetical protein